MDRKEQKENIIKLASLIKQCGELYAESLVNDSKRQENMKKISQLETEGDGIQKKLDDHFSHEKNIPYLALDRAELVRRMDDILDQVMLASRELMIYGSALDEKIIAELTTMAGICEEITRRFLEAVTIIYDDFAQAISITHQIEEIRDKGMETSFLLVAEQFKSASPETGWKAFEALNRILERTNKFIGHTKQASEVLEIMSLKYV